MHLHIPDGSQKDARTVARQINFLKKSNMGQQETQIKEQLVATVTHTPELSRIPKCKIWSPFVGRSWSQQTTTKSA